MKRYLTPYDVANTARLMRTLHAGTIIIVEGEIDHRFYKRFINEKECRLIPSNGKPNAIEALKILEKNSFNGILTIVDKDFWTIEGFSPDSPNILLTDTHDLETMVLSSNAFDIISSEFCSSPKIRMFGKPVRDAVLECALPLGLLRWLSSPSMDHLYLNFKNLSFDTFVERTTLKVDIDRLIREVINNSQNLTLDESEMKTKITTLLNEGHDPWQVCSGHDLIEILTIGLRNIFGNIRGQDITKEAVDGLVRAAYDSSCFRSTQLYKSIEEWEKANPSFKVL
jgi:hypothetical protein